jgi:murein L,D-transpeptidase YafK
VVAKSVSLVLKYLLRFNFLSAYIKHYYIYKPNASFPPKIQLFIFSFQNIPCRNLVNAIKDLQLSWKETWNPLYNQPFPSFISPPISIFTESHKYSLKKSASYISFSIPKTRALVLSPSVTAIRLWASH